VIQSPAKSAPEPQPNLWLALRKIPCDVCLPMHTHTSLTQSCLPVTKTKDMEHGLIFRTRLRRSLCTYLTLQTSGFHNPHCRISLLPVEHLRKYADARGRLTRSGINSSPISLTPSTLTAIADKSTTMDLCVACRQSACRWHNCIRM
jgi:hypothetical protein